jgi:hypothetical protein
MEFFSISHSGHFLSESFKSLFSNSSDMRCGVRWMCLARDWTDVFGIGKPVFEVSYIFLF